MITITKEISEATYAATHENPYTDKAEDLLFSISEICGYGVYTRWVYTTEEADGTHYWVRYNRGQTCD